MVKIEGISRLSDRRNQTSSDEFPRDDLERIESAVRDVPDGVFEGTAQNQEGGGLDFSIAEGLPEYEFEGTRAGGYNPECKLWPDFGYSVDLYHPDRRIAIEVEKSNMKSISDDLVKFQQGYRAERAGKPKIQFGCLVVPVNYRGSDNLYQHSLRKLDFMKGMMYIDDVAVIGYRIPNMN